MSSLSYGAAIVGAAEANEIGFLPERGIRVTSLQQHIEAIKNVSAMTGIPISDIDGVFAAGWTSELCEHLGLHPNYLDSTAVGGCSFQIHVHHALLAIATGVIDVALVSHGEAGRSYRGGGGRGGGGRGEVSPAEEATAAYGIMGAPSQYSHAMVRHMHRFGTTPEDFAEIAVVTRQWATLNPRAVMFSKETDPNGGPITVEQVQAGPMISWPMTIAHCCMVCDHGGAVLIAKPEIAKTLPTNPVWIRGAGESMGHSNMVEMDDFTATSAARSAKTAYRMAGMSPEDVGMAMIYDSFTITAAITAEMLGLAPRGKGHTLWKDGHAAPGGRLPINTNGGGLSFNHSGMYGMQLLVEAYRQLSRTAEDGVNGIAGKQTQADTCIVNGTGGTLSTTGTLILEADDAACC